MHFLTDLFGNLDSLVDAATDGAQQYRFWVPGTIIALEELGVPLPMPGDLLVMYLGFRFAAGSMTLAAIIPQMMIGIVIGVSGLYVVGRRWGRPFLSRYGVIWRLSDSRRGRAERVIQRYGFWGVAIGRHVGLRCPMTLFAGAFGLSRFRFGLAVVVSSVVWLALWLYVGAAVGASAAGAVKRLSYDGVVAALIVYLGIFVLPPVVHLVRSHRQVTR